MKIVYSKAFMEKFGQIVYNRQNEIFETRLKPTNANPFNFLLDWRVRKAVNLKNWLAEQINEPLAKTLVDEQHFLNYASLDDRITKIQQYVMLLGKYVGDQEEWGTPEHWSSLQEFADKGFKGDCEDGAVAIFILARTAGIPENKIKVVTGNVWDGIGDPKDLYISMSSTSLKQEDIKCQKELKDFKKGIKNGTIPYQKLQGLSKENTNLLKQSLKKVKNLKTKDKLAGILEVILCGNLSKIDNQFAKDVVKMIGTNSQYITSIKIDWITLQLIWKYYVKAVIQNTIIQKTKNSLLNNSKATKGLGGHCWCIYTGNDGIDYPIDWCFYSDTSQFDNRPSFWSIPAYLYGIGIWFACTDKTIYVNEAK